MQLQTIPTGVFTSGFIPKDRNIVNSLLVLLEINFKQKREPIFYSGYLNVSLKRLNKIADHYYKKTVYQLLQERIHQEAELLLQHTALTARQISLELGVCDPAHFSKCFKKIAGMSPGEYRKINKCQNGINTQSFGLKTQSFEISGI